MNYSEIFKIARKKKGLSQIEMAKLLGVSNVHLCLIEIGKRNPSNGLLDRLSYEMDIPLKVMMWFSVEETDIKFDKREIFKSIKPAVDKLILNLID
jgi:XRE family transcriptional regulator, regulator of sulfur utilization